MADENEEKKEAPVELTPEELEAKSKRKKKLLMMIIAGVVLLLGVGGGAFVFLSGGSDAELSAKSTESGEEGAKPSAPESATTFDSAEGAKPAEGGTETVSEAKPDDSGEQFGCTHPMKPFQVNLGNPLENHYLRLEISVEYKCSEESKLEITKRQPQLRDAVISIASKKTREFLLGPDGKAQLRKEILTRINHYMNRKVEDVFITDIMIE
jgi:flagellar FliL protein